jgi:hypothetical protein
MFKKLTFNSVFVLFVSLILTAAGVYVAVRLRIIPFATGLLSLGLGCFLWGWTDGFTDFSHKGVLFWKIGVLSLLSGVVLISYHFFKSF